MIKKILPDPNARKIKSLSTTVDLINQMAPEIEALSDQALVEKTAIFKQLLAERETSPEQAQDRVLEKNVLDMMLPEAFAVVREASKRVLGMRHFDVQLLGGIVLHNGGIAEMRTGEGKTLVATLPAYLNALSGKGVHVVTVNDYLAKRDAEWMGQLYNFLGLSVGVVLSDQRGFDSSAQKRQAYAADITYGTNNEFGFDYLRDNMATSKPQLVQRDFNHAIIDEVDSILIDEARTPLIISGRLEQSAELYQAMAQVAPQLSVDSDYTVDEKAKNVVLTEEGIDKAQEILGIEDLFDIQHNMAHHLLQALKAQELFKNDIDYMVKNDEVVIVDEFTGRLMEGRRWSDGLHQAVEAKENVPIQDETQTLASVTFQNLFRLYPKLSGMTGTAVTEEAEFGKIYNLSVTCIPTNRSDARKDLADTIYKTERIKMYKVVEEIVDYHLKGRPVLVGTVSIEKSEGLSHLLTYPVELSRHLSEKASRLSEQLQQLAPQLYERLAAALKYPDAASPKDFLSVLDDAPADLAMLLEGTAATVQAVQVIKKGLPHKVLNAKHHAEEALIVAQAGRKGAVTIATNMAGRGTDILLGGNPEYMARSAFYEQDKGIDWLEVPEEDRTKAIDSKKQITESEKADVLNAGGLHIIGTERHESRRIDNQLRGRAARQGDPGSTHFFLSLEDGLMRKFGGDRIAGIMDLLRVDETLPISAGMVSKAIEGAQRKVEAYYFDIRKNVLQYDDVLTEQRQLIYAQRKKVLNGENLRSSICHMIEQVATRLVNNHLPPGTTPQEWDENALPELLTVFHTIMPQLATQMTAETLAELSQEEVVQTAKTQSLALYDTLENELTQVSSHLEATHGVRISGLEEEISEKETNPKKINAEGNRAQQNGINDTSRTAHSSTETLAERNHPLRAIEREILLANIDTRWTDYLHNLDGLREGIGLRAYGQKDPLIEYKREAYDMFQTLTYDIQRDTVMMLFNTRIEIDMQGLADLPFVQENDDAVTNPTV
ncbi:MAG: preprotein translocase subunit SecA [Cyanobacteria bacterium P01_H01_bin.74]